MGNYESFVREIRKNHSLLNEKDEYGRTLLYLAARNGYYDICNFLLRSGCKVNETQKDGSTALHGAAFYGHQSIVQLLLEYEANPSIINKFGHSPQDEASGKTINDYIMSKTHDKINSLLNRLKSDGLAKNFVVTKHDGRIIGKKILRNLDYSSAYSTNFWTLAWHGTKYEHLYSIMKYGLHPAGAVLSPQYRISPQEDHIGLNIRVGSIDNWANAVFVSPSIFYAAHRVYSERIFCDQQQWCVLVETRVKPGSFTKHKQTLLNKRDLLPGEPTNVEYRVAVKSDEDFILQVESERNVIVTALVFIHVGFLENIDEYYQGEELFANSEAERALFQ
ncbi:unnamed protein product [Rotaria sordida]|uniref:Uncharacterized protein n=1 Tax=Rotaria sordida TaxID=392033 RepID=A0A815MA74_9BILA|nr:unnamed protein product [Rotaria sordida]CAF1420229.1 unnamed protein product [Rotaria sordida]